MFKMKARDGKKKHKWYMPSSFLIIILLMIGFIAISWILKAANVHTDINGKNTAINGLGVLDSLTAIWTGFKDKAEVILFILCVGGMLGVMTRTKAIDAGIERIVTKLNGKEIFIIPILMILFGLGGSTYGMWEETIAFFPVLIPVFIKAGYGPFTAVLTILLGAGTGCLASTVNPFATGVAFESASTAAGATYGQGIMMGSRWLTFVIFMAVAITIVMFVAYRTKKGKFSVKGINEEAIAKKFSKADKVEFNARRKWTIAIFMFGFFLMILAYLPWTDMIGQSNLDKFNNGWDKGVFWLASSKVWAPWGEWYFISVSGLFLLISLIVFAINRKDFVEKDKNKEQVFIGTFMNGSKDVLSVCLLIATAAGLGVILETSHIGPLIANSAKGLGNSGLIGFAVAIFFLSLILAFVLPSTSGFAAAFIPIFAKIAVVAFPGNKEAAIGLVIFAFIFAEGVINLIAPTSAALIAYTEYSGIPYIVWVKKMWPVALGYTLVSLLLIITFAGMAQAGVMF